MGVDKAGRYYVNGEGERAAPATAAIAPDTQRLRCGLARRPKSSGPPDCNASRQPADRAAATASRQANERGKDGRRWTFHPSPRRHTRRHTAGAGRSDPPAEGGTTSGGAGREGGRKPDALPSKGMQQGATGTGAIERAPSAPVSQGRCARRGRGGDASHGGRVAQAPGRCSRQGRRGATAGAREGGQRGRRRVGEGWAASAGVPAAVGQAGAGSGDHRAHRMRGWDGYGPLPSSVWRYPKGRPLATLPTPVLRATWVSRWSLAGEVGLQDLRQAECCAGQPG